jgi:hypothetical protein
MRSIKQFAPCPVCGFWLEVYDFNVCPSCGVEFGVDNISHTYGELRRVWVDNGAFWSSGVDKRPVDWNPWLQLILAGHIYDVPFVTQTDVPQHNMVRGGTANLSQTQVFLVHAT